MEIYGKDVRKEEDKASTGGKTCRIQDFSKYKEDVTKIHIVKNNLNQSCQFFFLTKLLPKIRDERRIKL